MKIWNYMNNETVSCNLAIDYMYILKSKKNGYAVKFKDDKNIEYKKAI